MLPETVLVMLGPATLLAQLSVSLIRMAFPDPDGSGTMLKPWVSPAMAVLLGIVFSFLLMLVGGISVSMPNVATAIIAGFIAGASAVGVTETTRRAT